MTARRPATEGERQFLLVPVAKLKGRSVETTLRFLLDRGWYVFDEGTRGLKHLNPADHICFYATKVGVVVEATVSGAAKRGVPPLAPDLERFSWGLRVEGVRYFFDRPTRIDVELRAQLDAFQGRDLKRAWNWFVQAPQRLTQHDFKVLTRPS